MAAGMGSGGGAGNNGGMGGRSGLGSTSHDRMGGLGSGGHMSSVNQAGGGGGVGGGINGRGNYGERQAQRRAEAEQVALAKQREMLAARQRQIAAKQSLQAQTLGLSPSMRDQAATAINNMDASLAPTADLASAIKGYSATHGRTPGLFGGLMDSVGLGFADRQSPEEDFTQAYRAGYVDYDPTTGGYRATSAGPTSTLSGPVQSMVGAITAPVGLIGKGLGALAGYAMPDAPSTLDQKAVNIAAQAAPAVGYSIPGVNVALGAYNTINQARELGAMYDAAGIAPAVRGVGQQATTSGNTGYIPQGGLMAETPASWSYGNWGNAYSNWG